LGGPVDGGTSLAILFWYIYIICNEENCTISEISRDGEPWLTFKRFSNQKLLDKWDELVAIVEDLVLSSEKDQLVWKLNSSGTYSSQSLYVVLNPRGVTLCL
jgi:hypothetical protein